MMKNVGEFLLVIVCTLFAIIACTNVRHQIALFCLLLVSWAIQSNLEQSNFKPPLRRYGGELGLVIGALALPLVAAATWDSRFLSSCILSSKTILTYTSQNCSGKIPSYVRYIMTLVIAILFFQKSSFSLMVLPLLESLLSCSIFHYGCVYAPKSFTMGEGLIISSSLSILSVSVISCLFESGYLSSPDVGKSDAVASILVFGAFVGCLGVHQASNILPQGKHADSTRVIILYGVLGAAIVSIYAAVYHYAQEPFRFLRHFLFGSNSFTLDKVRTQIFISWLVICILVLYGVPILTNKFITLNKESRVFMTRKIYHLAAVALFVLPIAWDRELVSFACAAILTLFLLLECIRATALPPWHVLINSFMSRFHVKRDSGSLILPHIYLLVGCAVPVWIASISSLRISSLVCLSGVLTLGVGDSMASIIGIHYGRRKWTSSSSKTVEGTIAAFLSMIVVVAFLHYMDIYMIAPALVLPTTASIALICLLEAFSTQIDNLVLPLYMVSMMQISENYWL